MANIESISALAFMDEKHAIEALLAHVQKFSVPEKDIMARASDWATTMRKQSGGYGVEAFLNAYGLNTTEGVALMCLAEALLRIPDAKTADALIRSTFEGRQWENYTGSGDSWLVNLSSWGLLVTGSVINFGQEAEGSPLHVVKNLVGRLGEPVIREALKKAMALVGGQFVLGETVSEAIKNGQGNAKQGYRFSYDILGESARSEAQVNGYMQSYRNGIALIGKEVPAGTKLFEAPGISVKLSALHARYQLVKRERVMQELLPRLKEIISHAMQAGISIAIDAEEASRLDIEMLIFEALLDDPEFADWNGIGFVVQAYQKRAFYLIDWLAELAKKHNRVIPVRLVKGAYWDSEIKWAQLQGLSGYPVFTRKEHTDLSYLACADKLLRHGNIFYPQFATHNARTAATVLMLAEYYRREKNSFEFQRLFGMGEALHDLLLAHSPSRIYAPVGTHKDLLAYLIRRMLENGANTSFVHLLMDRSKPVENILIDPVALTKLHARTDNVVIALPPDLYGRERQNSLGADFGNLVQLQELTTAIRNHADALQKIPDTTSERLDNSIAIAQKASSTWAMTSVTTRADILERAAHLFETHKAELMALCAKEAGRTLNDGLAEVREAIDFLRYYSVHARKIFTPQTLTGPVGESNMLTVHPRGVFACISPWNFPLSIFIGQISAALVTGNCVIAKPAEQTPFIAKRAVELLYEAGVPREALHLTPGKGEIIGGALVADKRIGGVVFTGGTATAQYIAESLTQRGGPLIPFIAETGGQNCMVVDSSALLEQAVDDIILSAFGSAGQRCSSLRVLFVQEDIADELLTLLSGAMQELTLGDPIDPSTDIGPVIDEEAKKMLLKHIEKMKVSAKFVASAPLPNMPGCFVAPHVFEIKNIDELKSEIFGPVLHVIRFSAHALPEIIESINSTGYGLTAGIHSRIDEHVRLFTATVQAGNIYVNRSMIGATVGVQPFGGERLSGTGPKAGGPHYLLRFVTERTTTINTAAIGGNVALLAG